MKRYQLDCGRCPRSNGCTGICQKTAERARTNWRGHSHWVNPSMQTRHKLRMRGPFHGRPAAVFELTDPITGAKGYGPTMESAYQNYLEWKDICL
jgi:hypothetical protein